MIRCEWEQLGIGKYNVLYVILSENLSVFETKENSP